MNRPVNCRCAAQMSSMPCINCMLPPEVASLVTMTPCVWAPVFPFALRPYRRVYADGQNLAATLHAPWLSARTQGRLKLVAIAHGSVSLSLLTCGCCCVGRVLHSAPMQLPMHNVSQRTATHLPAVARIASGGRQRHASEDVSRRGCYERNAQQLQKTAYRWTVTCVLLICSMLACGRASAKL